MTLRGALPEAFNPALHLFARIHAHANLVDRHSLKVGDLEAKRPDLHEQDDNHNSLSTKNPKHSLLTSSRTPPGRYPPGRGIDAEKPLQPKGSAPTGERKSRRDRNPSAALDTGLRTEALKSTPDAPLPPSFGLPLVRPWPSAVSRGRGIRLPLAAESRRTQTASEAAKANAHMQHPTRVPASPLNALSEVRTT